MSKFAEIKARIDAATKGPWTHIHSPSRENPHFIVSDEMHHSDRENCIVIDAVACQGQGTLFAKEVDLTFIINARDDLPLTLKALELACQHMVELVYEGPPSYNPSIEHYIKQYRKPDFWLTKATEELTK